MYDTFERVVVINLSRRLERWRGFLDRLPSDWPFRPPLRFPAVDGAREDVPSWWKTGVGSWGCYQSHLRIIEDCIANCIERVLILEDDALFPPQFSSLVREFLTHVPEDWQFIYLGGQHIEHHLGLPKKVNDSVYRPFNVNRTHAYAIRGQAMLQRIRAHLTDTEGWTSQHHIDHHLGEFHKSHPAGLYVPRRWLVAQDEGPSNVCDEDLPVRMFRGAEALADPQFDDRMVVVMGPYSGGTSAVAGMLHHLGISMGAKFFRADEATARGTFEAEHLADLCRRCFREPWLIEQVRPEIRATLLRQWAAGRRDHLSQPDRLAGAKHPLLCLMGPEIQVAWNQPFVVSVERDEAEIVNSLARRNWGWSLDAISSCTRGLVIARDLFLSDYPGPQLRIRFTDLLREPRAVAHRLVRFLETPVESAQLEKAIAHVERSGNAVSPGNSTPLD